MWVGRLAGLALQRIRENIEKHPDLGRERRCHPSHPNKMERRKSNILKISATFVANKD